MENDMITTQQAAQLTGVSQHTVARWAKEGLITAKKLTPRIWLVSKKEALALAGTLKPGPKPKPQEE